MRYKKSYSGGSCLCLLFTLLLVCMCSTAWGAEFWDTGEYDSETGEQVFTGYYIEDGDLRRAETIETLTATDETVATHDMFVTCAYCEGKQIVEISVADKWALKTTY